MKKIISLMLLSLTIFTTSVFAQYGNPYSEAQNQRDRYYNNKNEESEENNQKEEAEEISPENLLGLGISALGPEVNHCFRYGSFQTRASLAFFPITNFFSEYESPFTFSLKADMSFYNRPFDNMCYYSIGGFIGGIFSIDVGNDYNQFTGILGIDVSAGLRFTDKLELDFTSYLPVGILFVNSEYGVETAEYNAFYVIMQVLVFKYFTTFSFRYRL